MRKQLIELLRSNRTVLETAGKSGTSLLRLVDQLIANGVTIQKWIPVSERLPDTFGTFIVAVRIPTRKRTYSDSADFDPFAKKWTPSLYWGKGMNVTHWMPLPEPPKEE